MPAGGGGGGAVEALRAEGGPLRLRPLGLGGKRPGPLRLVRLVVAVASGLSGREEQWRKRSTAVPAQ